MRLHRMWLAVLVAPVVVLIAAELVTESRPGPRPIVVMAAGDISCDESRVEPEDRCRDLETSELLLENNPDAVLALGDLQYENGSYENFLAYYDETWGRIKGKTFPVPGNHEYRTADAEGYYRYFGNRAGDAHEGYYRRTLGNWELLALNSNVAMEEGSAQNRWLEQQLADIPASRCVLAFYHHNPPTTSVDHHRGASPGVDVTQPLLADLYAAGADLVLTGHAHAYERFAPQSATPVADADDGYLVDWADGYRAFIVGTGGKNLDTPSDDPPANSLAYSA
jgi:predicted phosphodiesterase